MPFISSVKFARNVPLNMFMFFFGILLLCCVCVLGSFSGYALAIFLLIGCLVHPFLMGRPIFRNGIMCLAAIYLAVAVATSLYPSWQESDAASFNYYALRTMSGIPLPEDMDRFATFLANVYQILNGSLLLGKMLSVATLLISAIIFIKLMTLLGYREITTLATLAFWSLVPTFVAFNTMTMRESYQLLYLEVALYLIIKFKLFGNIFDFFLAGIACFFFQQSHSGFRALSMVIFPLALFWPIRPVRLNAPTLLCFVTVLFFTVSYSYWYGNGIDDAVPYLKKFGNVASLDNIKAYRDRLFTIPANSHYGAPVDTSSSVNLLKSVGLAVIQYEYGPSPGEVRSIRFFELLLESALRAFLFLAAATSLILNGGVLRRLNSLFLTIYFIVGLMWALGTTNYGTATRHHTLAAWLLALAGGPFILKLARKAFSNLGRGPKLRKI